MKKFVVQLLAVTAMVVTLVGLATASRTSFMELDNIPVPQHIVDGMNMTQRAVTLDVTSPVCETSDGSPSVPDVRACIDALPGAPTSCVVQNGCCSHCTQMVSFGTAALGICGPKDHGTSCDSIRAYVKNMVDPCMSGGRIGGYQYLNEDSSVRIIVYHT